MNHFSKRNVMQDNGEDIRTKLVIIDLYFAISTVFLYKEILFRCIGEFGLIKSKVVFWALILLCSIMGRLIKKCLRKGGSLTIHFLNGYGIYTIISYIQIKTKMIVMVLMIVTVLSSVYAGIALCRKIKNRKKYWRIVKNRIKRIMEFAQIIYAGGIVIIILTLGANVLFDSTVMRASSSLKLQLSLDKKQTISDNKEVLVGLLEPEWNELNLQDRLNLLQMVAEIEKNYYDISGELRVGAADLEKNIHSYYCEENREIVINIDQLINASASENLENLLHEIAHCIQYRLVYDECNENLRETLFFKKESVYAEEFANYVVGHDDFNGYYNQNCEVDARIYAQDTVYLYYQCIDECEKKN